MPAPAPPPLPIDAALPEIRARLADGASLVLEAPPGAGKTTRVPLALLDAPWRGDGTILMLEPRRLAARAAAQRMADMLGEPAGATVGHRVRDDAKVSARTRVEVVTEGILTRRLQSDPGLEGVAAVIFDEIHERSIHADLGLALCLEIQAALRPELRLIAMSATLDAGRIAARMGAPAVRAEGRAHPVETRWLEAPLRAGARFEAAMADLIATALGAADAAGDALAFLPGAPEIERVARALTGRLPPDVDLLALHGALPFERQRAALAPPAPGRRKLVLATAIAETSLTIDGVRVVVDGGRARRARFDPGSGMSRLITTPVSRAAAEQRRGRAGRTAPGVCWRLWARGEEGALPEADPPEILEADLAPLALELALWGARPEELPFLDPPPAAGMETARGLLRDLGALDGAGALTAHGRALAAAPLHPRLAHMILTGGGAPEAPALAALLEERDPLRGSGADLAPRLAAIAAPDRAPERARPALKALAARAARLARRVPAAARPAGAARPSLGALVARAYPDRIAVARAEAAPKSDAPRRYLLSGGKGAAVAAADPLAGERFLAVAELDGDPREATVRLAARIDRAELEALFADRIETVESCAWSKREGRVSARRERRLGAAPLESAGRRDPDPAALTAAMADGVRQLGLEALPWSPAARRLQARAARARAADPGFRDAAPDLSDAALAADLDAWLTPHLAGMRAKADLARLELEPILAARLSGQARRRLDQLAPPAYAAPTGTRAPIDYAGDAPRISIRLQEMFGVTEHPRVAGAALLIELLSPAGRPIQTTADLPGFWRGSYREAAKEMRARYPKHPWPDDPAAAAPTRRAKPRRG